jgi:hypothetical protein
MKLPRFSLFTLITASLTAALLLFANLRPRSEPYVALMTIKTALGEETQVVKGDLPRKVRVRQYALRYNQSRRGWPAELNIWIRWTPFISDNRATNRQVKQAIEKKEPFTDSVTMSEDEDTSFTDVIPEAEFLENYPEAKGKIIDSKDNSDTQPAHSYPSLALNTALALLLLAAFTALAECLQRRRTPNPA